MWMVSVAGPGFKHKSCKKKIVERSGSWICQVCTVVLGCITALSSCTQSGTASTVPLTLPAELPKLAPKFQYSHKGSMAYVGGGACTNVLPDTAGIMYGQLTSRGIDPTQHGWCCQQPLQPAALPTLKCRCVRFVCRPRCDGCAQGWSSHGPCGWPRVARLRDLEPDLLPQPGGLRACSRRRMAVHTDAAASRAAWVAGAALVCAAAGRMPLAGAALLAWLHACTAPQRSTAAQCLQILVANDWARTKVFGRDTSRV